MSLISGQIEEEIEEIVTTYGDGPETDGGGHTETETEGDEGSRRESLASQTSTLLSGGEANSGELVSSPVCCRYTAYRIKQSRPV